MLRHRGLYVFVRSAMVFDEQGARREREYCSLPDCSILAACEQGSRFAGRGVKLRALIFGGSYYQISGTYYQISGTCDQISGTCARENCGWCLSLK